MASNPQVSNIVIAPIDASAQEPDIAFGGVPNSGTGIRGTFGEINISVDGSDVAQFVPTGLELMPGASLIVDDSTSYAGDSSFQPIGPDLNLASGAGDNTDTSFLAAVMGNLIGDALTKTKNYLAGVIGMLSVTGTRSSTYPVGAVLAGIADGVSEADGAVVAFIDGDSAQTNANAAFKAMSNNSTAGSGFDFGVDLHGAAHDGYPVLAIKKADIRMSNQVCILNGSGVPVDGTTGLNVAGPGSLYIDISAGKLWINTSAAATPVWVVVGSQS